ncbi:MAG TPA: hypothetical protein VEC06_01555 [Paucimonas sp.]|nr:hypothetical protein [Paucimonas sp.]
MKPTRTSRFVTALVALFGVLFMQLAVAAYACPNLDVARMLQAAEPAQPVMAGCEEMDAEQPVLCYAYGQAADQSLDKPSAPQIPPFIPAALVNDIEPVLDALHAAARPAPEPALARATAPPLSIRHCCFRN